MPESIMYQCQCGREYNAGALLRCPSCQMTSRESMQVATKRVQQEIVAQQSAVAAGWYPDPNGLPSDRYWDGSTWTDQTRPQAVRPPAPQRLIVEQAPFAQPAPAYRGYNQYGSRSPQRHDNGMGTAALVMGILGLFLGWLFSLLAVIFGSIGIGRAERGEASNESTARWGAGLGWVGLGLWTIVVILIVANS